MRIALALSGETRSFFEEPSLLDALRQKGCVVDVFAHLPATDPGIDSFHEFWKSEHKGFQLRSVQVSDVRHLSQEGIVQKADCVQRPWYRDAGITSCQAYLRQFAANAAVGSLVRQAESQDRTLYDWVIRARYDLKFFRPMEQLVGLERALYVPSHDSSGGYNDKFAFGPSEAMKEYFNLYDALPELCRTGVLFHPETSLKAHLDACGIPARRTTSISRVVRYGVHDVTQWVPDNADVMEPQYLPETDGAQSRILPGDKVVLDEMDRVIVFTPGVRPVPQRQVVGMQHFYESIDGWFDFQDIYSEAVAWAQDGAKFVEIGSWLGKSAVYMGVEIANSGKQIEFYAVDTWKGASDVFDKAIQSPVVAAHGGSLKKTFLANVSPVGRFVEAIENKSVAAASQFEDKSLDFVFIDAGHSYEDVSADIKAWLPKVKPGGVLAGHDYSESHWYGVVQAVRELLPGYMIRNPVGPTPLTMSWEYAVPA